MRAVLQRVNSARVTVGSREVSAIDRGILALVGVERGDAAADVEYIATKIKDVRIFEDEHGKMNRSIEEVAGAVLVVSQFTLSGDLRKGRRPSFDDAAPPDEARVLYESVAAQLRACGLPVATGEFRAMMQIALVNDGPVTILLDSRKRF